MKIIIEVVKIVGKVLYSDAYRHSDSHIGDK